MAPKFLSAATKHTVRPLMYAPGAVTLPILLTNIIPEQFPYPRLLTNISISDTNRTPSPPPASRRPPPPPPPRRAPMPAPPHPPARAPTPAPARASTPAPARASTPAPRHPTPDSRDSSLTPVESEDDNVSVSSFTAKKPKADLIPRPSAANIQVVKSLLVDLYPDLVAEEQLKEYTAFRSHLDVLCARYLRPSLALSHQNKDQLEKLYAKMTETFEWLVEYDVCWPASVCLQGKLHNSAAHSMDKSTRKVVAALTGVVTHRAGSKRLEKKRKAQS
ncbi:hypothetical protein C8R44DRAFT_745594 [Mycena epipterygia]|nr:hypothetical protein C8R44DRAFT_745594 [Mycena epipterygia]